MTPRVLREQWESYRAEVIPADAPEVQIVECRRAFYAGARAFQAAAYGAISDDDDITEQDLAVMKGLYDELDEFKADLEAGRA